MTQVIIFDLLDCGFNCFDSFFHIESVRLISVQTCCIEGVIERTFAIPFLIWTYSVYVLRIIFYTTCARDIFWRSISRERRNIFRSDTRIYSDGWFSCSVGVFRNWLTASVPFAFKRRTQYLAASILPTSSSLSASLDF